MSYEEEVALGGLKINSNMKKSKFVEVGCTSARIQLWVHNKKKSKFWERIEDHFKASLFQNFGVPIQSHEKGKSIYLVYFIYIYIL